MIEALDFRENVANFLGGENHRQLELRVGANQLQFVRPGTFESLFPEELKGADELSRRLAGDFLYRLKVDAVLANLLKGYLFGRTAVVLAELANAGQVSLLGAGANRQELEVIGEGFQDGVRRGFFICMTCINVTWLIAHPHWLWAAVNQLERLYARRKPPNPKRLFWKSPRSGSVQHTVGDNDHCGVAPNPSASIGFAVGQGEPGEAGTPGQIRAAHHPPTIDHCG